MSEENQQYGEQHYGVSEMGTDAAHAFEAITNIPTTTILSKPSDGNLTPAEIKNGRYKRVIIVRYTGSIREVILEDYQLFKGELAKGIYQPYEFTWYLIGRNGKSAETLNSDTAKSIIARVDGPLQQSEIGKTVSLAVDTNKYTSPLRT